MTELTGIGAAPGVAIGTVRLLTRQQVELPSFDDPLAAFAGAVAEAHSQLQSLAAEAREKGRSEAAAVLEAQALMAQDPLLTQAVSEGLETGLGLQQVIDTGVANLSAMLAALDDEYLAARAADVAEVGQRILSVLAGADPGAVSGVPRGSIVAARNLTAAETASLDPARVAGFVTVEGGRSDHVAVIARSLGIPAVVGVAGLLDVVEDGRTVIVDGDNGTVVHDPDEPTLAVFESRIDQDRLRREASSRYRGARTRFGAAVVEVVANVGVTGDLTRAVEEQAEGIGLLRTEFLFLDRQNPPTADEQYEIYAEAAASFRHPVVIRTLDVGGDKPLPYLDLDAEDNPFLGERGVRLYRRHEELFRDQVRALLRASAHGEVWMMVPMVATVADLLLVREVVDQVSEELTSDGVEVGRVPLGVMIEVPSAALIADHLAAHADFFSIGTNDLTQYTMAADRTHGRLGDHSDPAHPAILELCHLTARAATRAGIPVSVCGEAAADPDLAVAFAAMGTNKLSVSPPLVNPIKARLAESDAVRAREALKRALESVDADAARSALRDSMPG